MAQVLLVGDEKSRTSGLKSILAMDGHDVASARDIRRWRDEERGKSPDVVVAAVAHPDMVLGVPLGGGRVFAPAILFVHEEQDEVHERYVEERLIDRLTSPFPAEDLLARVDALARVRRVVLRQDPGEREAEPAPDLPDGNGRWERIGRRLSSTLNRKMPRYAKPSGPYLEVASRVAEWSDRRDSFEPGHADRVTGFAAMIAEELEVPDADVAALLRAAMLHDIGKVSFPVEILRQRGPLDEEQARLMRTHPERGAAILRALDRDEEVAQAIQFHHERADGQGYYGKSGEEIPLLSRVLAVAEAYDAMTTSRVRATLPPAGARAYLQEKRGTQFDAACVDALLEVTRPSRPSISLSLP